MIAHEHRLPRSLETWREALELFPADLQLTMGAWLPRIAGLVGRFARERHSVQGEPDGFAGIENRGPYERLLIGEWALAELYPDEFLRRAAMGEHTFYQLAHREPASSRRASLLLDAGPSQLGGPRLAQLALLIVVEQRMRHAGIEFHWGMLQARRTFTGIHRNSIVAFLDGHTCREPTHIDFEDWTRLLAPQAGADCSIAGGHCAVEFARAHGAQTIIRIHDPLAAQNATVGIDIIKGESAGRSLRLAMPPTPDAIRLMRDAFTVRRAIRSERAESLSRTPRLTFSRSNHRLFALSDSGNLLAFHVPNAPGCQPGNPKRFVPPEGERVVAAQMRGRRLAIATLREETGILIMRGVFGARSERPVYCQGILGPVDGRQHDALPFVPPTGAGPLCTLELDFFLGGIGGNAAQSGAPALLDGDNNLYRWNPAAETPPTLIATNVLAYWPGWARVAVRTHDNELQLLHCIPEPSQSHPPKTLAQAASMYAIAPSTNPNDLVFLERNERGFELVSPGTRQSVSFSAGDAILGVTQHKGVPVVVVQDAASLRVFFVAPSGRTQTIFAAAPTLDIVISPDGAYLACLSNQGHLQVYSLVRGNLVLDDTVDIAP